MGAPNTVDFEEMTQEPVYQIEPRKFRKKPVIITAVPYNGENVSDIRLFAGTDCKVEEDKVCILTLEGKMEVSVGDYVIQGVQGEFYPCKPDIFEQTYAPWYEEKDTPTMTIQDMIRRDQQKKEEQK